MTNNLLIVCLLAALLTDAQSAREHCQTPDNKYGVCIHIRSCDVLLARMTSGVLFQEDREFLLRSKCDTKPTDVCCPSDTDRTATEIATTPTPTRTTTYSTSIPRYRRPPRPRRPRTTTTPRTTITPRTTTTPATRISTKKCNEYADLAYDKMYITDVTTDVQRVVKTSNCGFQHEPLIVGGVEAKRGEFPHQALIGFMYNGQTHWDCGGTLISEQFVMSAEHCSNSSNTGRARFIRLGEHDISRPNDANHSDYEIVETIFHENVPQKTYNDIVLFKLDRKVEFNHAIRPACLPEQSTVPRNVSASGWGTTRWRARRGSRVLQKVNLITFSPDERDQSDIGRNFSRHYDEESIVYAGHLTEERDTCQGDSGGPLQFLHDIHHCTYVVAGITSTGKKCGEKGTPAIYTGVYTHLDWIEKTVWPNE